MAREIASKFRDDQDPASSGQDRLGGALPAPGQPRVAVHAVGERNQAVAGPQHAP